VDVVLALVAAFFFALGLVLQEKAASSLPADAVGAGFLVRLARQPIWLLGLGAQAVGFVAQAIALGIGRIVIVQPLLISTIVFALPLGRLLEGRRISRNEWVGATVVTLGLATLLLVSRTSEGADDTTFARWALIGGGTVGVAVALFVLATGRAPAVRACLLGTGGGILFGLSAALTKTVISELDDGVLQLFTGWHVYALVVVSVAAFWLEQAALQTGALAAAVATTMSFDALSSIFLGVILFDEALHETALGLTASLLSLAAALAGLVLLARSKQEGAQTPEPQLAPA
jgi:drug/metabolite transporter (DMT)-like permease